MWICVILTYSKPQFISFEVIENENEVIICWVGRIGMKWRRDAIDYTFLRTQNSGCRLVFPWFLRQKIKVIWFFFLRRLLLRPSQNWNKRGNKFFLCKCWLKCLYKELIFYYSSSCIKQYLSASQRNRKIYPKQGTSRQWSKCARPIISN